MEFNNTFVRTANYIYSSANSVSIGSELNQSLSLENNNMFNRYLITKVDDNEFEIPIIAKDYIEGTIIKTMSPSTGIVNIQSIILPLYENCEPQEKRTFDSFIRQFFVNVNYNDRLQKITSNKGEIYYGGKGLIFDNRYNPLILCTLKVKKIQIKDTFKISYLRPIIHINPIVFIESNKLINKGIIKKLIPYYANEGISFPPYSRYTSVFCDTLFTNEDKKATIIVGSLDKFFVKPTIPKPQNCITESLNDCLVNNINDILGIICL